MKKLLTITYISGIAILPVILSSSPAAAQTQQDETKSTIRVAANPEYDKAGKMKRFFFGDHYRKEWATPVEIELLDLEVEAGGLTVIKMGGGLQTKSLRLRGGNGREYVLRTVDKDPSKAIVYELRGTFADDVVQDQISSGNPYAPLVVASLAEAAGIFHTTPKLVYVTKSPRLGEFGPFFDSTLCLLEERPSGSEEDNAAYNFSKKILNTEKVFEKVLSNSSFEVDQKAFLKARLFDMLIGDWDRHEDQWLWASFEKENKTIFQPIPRDRDQAFSKMDGVIPQLATRKWAIRKIQNT
jgi:hypothetical protein